MNEILIAFAKVAILVALNQPDNFDLEYALKTYPSLQKNGAVFVTITTDPDDQLRGCIGSLHAYRHSLRMSFSMHRLLPCVTPDFQH